MGSAKRQDVRSHKEAEELFLANRWLVRASVKKMIPQSVINHIGRDECEALAEEAMWRACHLYEEGKYKLSTYVYKTVKYFVMRHTAQRWTVIQIPAWLANVALAPHKAKQKHLDFIHKTRNCLQLENWWDRATRDDILDDVEG